MKTRYLLFIVLAAISVVRAQVGDSKKSASSPTRSVVNEDRGKACIILDNTLPGKQGAKFIVEPKQYSIFLGKGWAADSLRARESTLSNLISSAADTIPAGYFEQFGWNDLYSVNNYEEKLGDVGIEGVISDLQIQNVLADIIRDNAMAQPRDDTTYVIYLEPTLTSRLGPIVGGKHYLAYHNAFTTSGMRIRYVVVPYEENLRTTRRRALSGFISALLKPDCQ